mgnify:FL=1
MLIDLIAVQLQKFDALATKIADSPEEYLQFESVSDFYKATWLNDFPKGTTWAVSGLDNGADEFCIRIVYRNHYLMIDVAEQIQVYQGVVSEGMRKY